MLTVIVLGRVLLPGEFGVVAAALSVTIILHAVRDVGLGPALIQRKALDAGHIATAFSVAAYLGVVLAGGLVMLAPLIGRLYRIPESINVLRALALIFALRGVATVSNMMCQRTMRFRAIAIIDTGSYAAGSVASMSLALAGAGPWSLVGGYLLEELISTAAYLWLWRPPWNLRVDRQKLRDLLSFGASQSVIQVAGILATYGDNFVVGNVLGKQSLGYYTRAYDLTKIPSAVFSSVVGSVLFPAFSRLQDDRARLAAGFRRILFANSLFLFPMSTVLMVTAPEVIHLLMGERWDEAVVPFQILCVTMMFRTTYKVGAMVASAAGQVRKVAIANIVYMLAVVGGAAVTIRFGIVGVATSTAAALCVIYVYCTALAIGASGLSWWSAVTCHVPGLGLAALSAVSTAALAAWLRPLVPGWALIAIAGSTGGLVILLGLVLGSRKDWSDFRWLESELRRVFKRRPRA